MNFLKDCKNNSRRRLIVRLIVRLGLTGTARLEDMVQVSRSVCHFVPVIWKKIKGCFGKVYCELNFDGFLDAIKDTKK